MLRVGLSGGIGSGKSTVARALARRGAIVIDADAIAREVVEPGEPGLAAVVDRFGPEVLDSEGRLDRPRLAALVFDDAGARADLNAIVHPRVAAETARRIAAAPSDAVVVIDVPLLVEAARSGYDAVVIVEAPEAVRLERLVGRGMAPDDARRRMSAQASDADRRKVADVILDNAGSEEDLERQIDALWAQLTASLRT
ncbi:MAG TPA: dephospho-CoA kinase [Acidimicrobiia bacterium]|jgi:dephospho-CoA kinase|nr:dephospho-CoA kinase [Acidimicrobiia bacterium]